MDVTKGQIAPTQAKITELNHAMSVARNASNLLNKKAQVFDMYQKDYAKKLESNTELLDNVMKEAFFTLATARYVVSPLNLSAYTQEMVQEQAAVRILSFHDRFLGNAKFYTISQSDDPDVWPMAGLAKGGNEILKVKKIFRKAAEILVGHVCLQSVFTSLCKAKEIEMRKSIIIQKIMIPNIQYLINHIRDYLDDVERDDMYRYKLVKKRLIEKRTKMKKNTTDNSEDLDMIKTTDSTYEDDIFKGSLSTDVEQVTHVDKDIFSKYTKSSIDVPKTHTTGITEKIETKLTNIPESLVRSAIDEEKNFNSENNTISHNIDDKDIRLKSAEKGQTSKDYEITEISNEKPLTSDESPDNIENDMKKKVCACKREFRFQKK